MSDTSQGPGWWQASDDKWYPPDQAPGPDPSAQSQPGQGQPGQGQPGQGQPWQGQPWQGTGGAPGWAEPSGSWPSGGPNTGPGFGGAPGGYGAPGYGASPYGAPSPYGGYAPAMPSAQGQATASMVLGIIALLLFWCWFLGVVLALIGLPLGFIALNKINKGQVSPDGKGIALAGVICSGIALALSMITLLFFFAN